MLAAAGLRRLGFGARISFTLPASACVPAPGQGIVAVEIRDDAEAVRRVVAPIDDAAAGAALRAERALVEALGGGCQTPIGALATLLEGETIEIVAAVVTAGWQSRRCARRPAAGCADAAAIGVRAAPAAAGRGRRRHSRRGASGCMPRVEGIQP